jgi:hypothetical protein
VYVCVCVCIYICQYGGGQEEGAVRDNEGEPLPLSKLAQSVFDLFRRVLTLEMEQGEGGGGGGGGGAGGGEEEVLHSVLWAFPLGESTKFTGFTGTTVRILTHKLMLVAVHLPSHTLESESRYAFSL